jgi:hypothetical protein
MEDNINILDELKSLDAGTLISLSRKNVYFLPDDYFSDLPINIIRQIWLNSVPIINPYHIPPNYFEHLPELILDKLAVQNQVALKSPTYEVPDGYFNNLAENILGNIKAGNNNVQQELEELSPLLNTIPKVNVYTVPAEYFESLNPAPVRETQPAKIVSIKSKPRRWIAYAAAACIAALMFGGGYYYMQDKNFNDNNTSAGQNQVAEVKVQQAISQLSDAEIDSYLKNDDDVYIPQNDTQDINIKFLLENMSDEEINNYLIENSDPGENTKGI